MEGNQREYTFKMFDNKCEHIKDAKLTINEKITIG